MDDETKDIILSHLKEWQSSIQIEGNEAIRLIKSIKKELIDEFYEYIESIEVTK